MHKESGGRVLSNPGLSGRNYDAMIKCQDSGTARFLQGIKN